MTKKHNVHPNSMKVWMENSTKGPPFTSETAKLAQKKSVEARRRNKEAKQALRLAAATWKDAAEDIKDAIPDAISVLNVQMVKALADGDTDQAIDLAKILAEYQAPKLARTENTNVEISADEMSDEELEAKLAELVKPKDEPEDD